MEQLSDALSLPSGCTVAARPFKMRSAILIVNQPGQRARKLEVCGGLTSIGRRPDNIICLAGDSKVSKYHAMIENRDDGFWVSDLGSSNGTTVNEAAIKSGRKLLDGDLICFGGTSTVEFRVAEAQPPAGAPAAGSPQPERPPPQSAGGNPPPAAVAKRSGTPLVMIAGVVGGLALTGALVAVLFSIGVLGEGPSAKKKVPPKNKEAQQLTADPAPAADRGEAPAPSADEAASTVTEFEKPGAAAGGPAAIEIGGAGAEINADLARMLALQISQKNVYKFDSGFINFINLYVSEYRADPNYFERAQRYRDLINTEFTNNRINPLFGYIMAMSLSKFNEQKENNGVWQIPPAVVKYYAPNEPGSLSTDPLRSTQIAAAHVRDLLDKFGADGFMYAVACYGMTPDEYGKTLQRLVDLGTREPEVRYDFWKMKNASVIGGQQVERVARFFAAGIVCENPDKYRLKAKPFSSLYDY